MLLKVFTGPHPHDNLDMLLRHISVLQSPLCAVTPDNRSAASMQHRLAVASGGAFMGHRILTMEGLAAAVAAECGPIPGIIREHMRRSLVAEIVRSRFGGHSRYAAVAGYPGFVTLFESYIEDVRSGRADAGELGPEFDAALAAYASHLHRLGLTDHEGMIARALEGDAPERFAGGFRGPLIVHGFYDLTVNQFRLIERLVRSFPRSAVTVTHDPARPRLFSIPGRLLERCRAIGGVVIPSISGEEQTPVRTVMDAFMGDAPPDAGGARQVEIHCFRSERAEADWVAGTVASLIGHGGFSPDDIMVVSRRMFPWAGCMERALRRHGVPIADGVMRTLSGHPVVKFAFDALEASVRHDDETLMSVVQSSAFRAPAGVSGEPADDRGWSGMFAEVDSPEGYIQSFRRMLDWLGTPGRLEGGGEPARAASERAAWERLIELAGEFADFHAPFHRMLRSAEFVRLFRRFIEPVMISDGSSPSAGVLLTDVNHARYSARGVVFVTGTHEANFPAGTSGWSLHRRETGEHLREDHAAEEPLLFYMAAQGAERLWLTFPGIDDEGKDSAMSPYLREIKESVAPWSTPQVHAAVPGAAWERGAHDSRGSLEELMRRLKHDYRLAPGILAMIGNTAPETAGALRRAVRIFARYAAGQGIELAGSPAFEPGSIDTDRVFSVTELETYLECPVRYFLGRIIGLDVEEPAPGEIAPADRGRIVHDILARFYRERMARPGRASFAREELPDVREHMRSTVDMVFSEARSGFYGIHPAALVAEKGFIAGWMDAFIDAEADYFGESGFEPFAFEVAFGKASGERESADATAPPLALTSDEDTILVGGRIDRIDRSLRGRQEVLRVIDYKTGAVETRITDLTEGHTLQAPLYLKAALAMHPGSAIHDGRYYSLQDMELKGYSLQGSPLAGPDWDSYIALAGKRAVEAVTAIRRGSFPMPAGKCSQYCEFLPVCRGGRKNGNGGEG